MQDILVWFLGREDPLEEEMATHSSILAWRVPWTEEPAGLQSLGLQSQTRQSGWAQALARTSYMALRAVVTGEAKARRAHISSLSVSPKLSHGIPTCFLWPRMNHMSPTWLQGNLGNVCSGRTEWIGLSDPVWFISATWQNDPPENKLWK